MEWIPESDEVLAQESEEVLASASEEVLAPDSEELLAPDSLSPDSETMVPDSEEVLAPDSEELLAPDSLQPGSETMVPDSLPPCAFLCPRCHLVHEDRESWNRAHSWLWPCARCSLVHFDYWLSSTLRRDEFDCTAALAVKREMEEGEQEWRKMNNK
ncbi:unnamed protein product [Urochloa humidicola]